MPLDPKKKVYSPSGEYFTNIVSALSYAGEKWGLKMPMNQQPYDQAALANVDVPEHIRG